MTEETKLCNSHLFVGLDDDDAVGTENAGDDLLRLMMTMRMMVSGKLMVNMMTRLNTNCGYRNWT